MATPDRIIPRGIPFAQIPHDVATDPNVTSSAYRVYGFLMKLANSEGRAWPGHRYLAEHLPMSKPTIASAIRCLEEAGWLTVNRTQQAHTYVVHGNRSRNQPGQETEPVKKPDQSGQEPLPEPGKKLVHIENQDLHPPTNNQRSRDLLWEAFIEVHGDPATGSERGKFNRIVAKLREADVEPEEYPTLVAAYTAKHDGLQPAPATIAERVGELRHFIQRGPIRSVSLEDVERRRRFEQLDEERRLG